MFSSRGNVVAKRGVDIVLGSVLLLVSLPLLLAFAVGTALALHEWPFFCQRRVGIGGRPFRFIKFRTLPSATPAYASKYDLGPSPAPRFSRWLRSRHADELPQLLLVVVGRMSLVGPRPEMPGLHEQMTPSFAEARVAVRPGCTGLWQIGPDAYRLIGEAPEYDLHYIRNSGLLLDIWVLWHSLRIMFLGRPPVSLDAVPPWTIRRARSTSSVEPSAALAPASGSDGGQN